jgi:hypothetical protein
MRTTASLLCFASLTALVVACGGSVAPVGDSSNTPTPAPTTTSPPGAPVTDPTTKTHPKDEPLPVPPIAASSYDGSCSADTDCVAITEIAGCGCACPNAAINQRDLPRVQADEAARETACRQNHAPGCGVMCSNGTAYCDTTLGVVGACKYQPTLK